MKTKKDVREKYKESAKTGEGFGENIPLRAQIFVCLFFVVLTCVCVAFVTYSRAKFTFYILHICLRFK
jgi:hypothetical protein